MMMTTRRILLGAGIFCGIALGACGTAAPPVDDPEPPQRPEAARWSPADGPLMTRWAADVSPENALPEYPRPQMRREAWHNLNGLWQYSLAEEGQEPPFGRELEGRILVPFPIQSALSGVMEHTDRIWYRRTFTVPEDHAGRMLLHFGAVDWKAEIYVNGRRVGAHRGGYDAFSFDITDALEPGGEQELVVGVFDPTDEGDQPRGKQVEDPRGIWYTPVTGIWQTVWLEPVPEAHIRALRIVPDVDDGAVRLTVEGAGTGPAHEVAAEAVADGRVVGRARGGVGDTLRIAVPEPRLWSPDDPYLYDLRVSLRDDGRSVDAVDSYFGMRTIELGREADGTPRILVNGEPVFQLGPLDQGYWPDGLYTAPTDDALRYDLEITKALGFDMTRKHVKVEPARWYYWADRLGLLVWQDMPNGDNGSPAAKRQFEAELDEVVEQFRNHPSIVVWVPFNEGWGQFDTERITNRIEALDPSRLVVDASGWQHMQTGDIIDVHRYPGPQGMEPAEGRASVVGEFGGAGFVAEGHTWAGEGWGYRGTIPSRDSLTDRYEQLINQVRRLEETAGMSAGIYTQITDVEREVNGLLTYDRAIVKVDSARAVAANRGRTPHILPEYRAFVDSVTVRIATSHPDVQVRYTLDGSRPTATSPRYDGPFRLTDRTTVRARAFEDGEPGPALAQATFETVPGRAPADPGRTTGGVEFSYYESEADGNRFRRHWPLRRQLNNRDGDALSPVETGVVERFTLAPRRRDDLFGFQYRGYIEVPRTGVYTFEVRADDAAQLFIGETRVIGRFGQSPKIVETTGSIALQAGLHPITVNHFQAYGPHGLEVYYEGPGVPRQPVSASALVRRAEAADVEP